MAYPSSALSEREPTLLARSRRRSETQNIDEKVNEQFKKQATAVAYDELTLGLRGDWLALRHTLTTPSWFSHWRSSIVRRRFVSRRKAYLLATETPFMFSQIAEECHKQRSATMAHKSVIVLPTVLHTVLLLYYLRLPTVRRDTQPLIWRKGPAAPKKKKTILTKPTLDLTRDSGRCVQDQRWRKHQSERQWSCAASIHKSFRIGLVCTYMSERIQCCWHFSYSVLYSFFDAAINSILLSPRKLYIPLLFIYIPHIFLAEK